MTATRKLLASLLLVLTLGGAAACSAEGDVDSGTDGDGVKVEGDVDGKETEDE